MTRTGDRGALRTLMAFVGGCFAVVAFLALAVTVLGVMPDGDGDGGVNEVAPGWRYALLATSLLATAAWSGTVIAALAQPARLILLVAVAVLASAAWTVVYASVA